MGDQIVHIVDDDDYFLDSIKELIESRGLNTRTYSDGPSFLESYDASSGCLVLDVRMPFMNGLQLQQKLKKMNKVLPIIFITGYGDVETAVEAMKQGAVDFIQKPYQEQSLLDSINAALKLDSLNRMSSTEEIGFTDRLSTLTAREHEVMNMLCESNSNKEIARILGISPRTVEVHRRHLMKKLDIKTVQELIDLKKLMES